MRALVALNSLELGGTQINAVDLADVLRRRGVESTLVGLRSSLPDGPSLLDYAEQRTVDVRAYDGGVDLRKDAAQLTRLADDLGADIVHVYGTWGAARPVFWGPARWGRRPWVHTVYEMRVDPVVLGHMPLIVGTGGLLEEQSRRRPGRTLLIPPPVDLENDSPHVSGLPDLRRDAGLGDGPLIGIVSRLDSRSKLNAITTAIESMRTHGERGATLFIVGGGDAMGALGESAARVNESLHRDVVRFLGPSSDPRPAYAAADIILGMGGSAARALAFGKPLIVQGDVDWCRLFDPESAAELSHDSYWSTEVLADPVRALTVEIGRLLDDPSLRASLGEFGRAFAEKTFGLEAMAERLHGVYTEAASTYGPAAWMADLPRESRRLVRKVGRSLGVKRDGGAAA